MYRSIPIISVQNQTVDLSCNTSKGCVKNYIWNVPNDNIYKNKTGCDNGQRSRKTVIRSGMQENKRPYSFSYHQHMKNFVKENLFSTIVKYTLMKILDEH